MSKTLENNTVIFFNLSGLYQAKTNKSVFVLSLTTYLLIIVVNMTLIGVVCVEKSLHEPMYIFVCNLSVNGLYRTVGFYPKFLSDLLSDFPVVSYSACLTQAFVIQSSVPCEIAILTVMAYDRYIAICKPLRYKSILSKVAVLNLLCYIWSFPSLLAVVAVILTLRVPICGSQIEKIFCDNSSVLKQACIPITPNQIWAYILVLSQGVQLFFVVYSYIQIIVICMTSREGRRKFMKTCVPHLLSMIIFIITTLFDFSYGWQTTQNLPVGLRDAMSLQFLVLPPLLNPIIYGLQLKQIRKAVCRTCHF